VEREFSQLAAATIATGAFFMKFRASIAWRRAADWGNPRFGFIFKTRLRQSFLRLLFFQSPFPFRGWP
jgi:hypothetical protein